MRRTAAPHRAIWTFAWPATVSNLSIPLLALVDTAILGHLDNALYLSAVAVGGSVISLLYWAFSFLRMGTTSLSARSFGANDHPGAGDLLIRALTLGALIGVFLAVVGRAFLPWLVNWVGAEAAVVEPALSYAAIRLYSAPATLMTYALVGWFLGQQKPKISLIILLATNISNIILDYLFIIGLALNSDGAAYASLCAEIIGLLTGLACLGNYHGFTILTERLRQITRLRPYQELLTLNSHLFVRTLALQLCFMFFTAQSARQGELVLAANTILINLLLTTAYGLDGIAHAAEALVGKAVGARKRAEFYATCRGCTLWSLVIALGFCLFFALASPWLPGVFTDLTPVLNTLQAYYPWLIGLPLLAVWCYLLDGIFIGAGRTADMQWMMLLSTVGVFLPAWWLTQGLGNHGLWLAFCLWNLARGLSLGLIFYHRSRQDEWIPDASYHPA